MNLLEQMHILADADYRLFQIRLMPSVDAGRVLGVRMPDLRELAKKQKNSPQKPTFCWIFPIFFTKKTICTGFSSTK